jgi:mono/diheme cytochrome c family protein
MALRKYTAAVIITAAFIIPASAQSKFRIPSDFKSLKNPVPTDAGNTEQGRLLYAKHCAYCHGKRGEGDGGKSKALKTSPKDLSSVKFQNLTPGEQFYSSKTGRGEMPDYSRKLTDTEVWQIVIYMKSFRKGKE